MKNQSGQVILALILVMSVALAIGLSIVQKSLVDVSTATKVEESQRAFSAAEAGIEKALTLNGDTNPQHFDNNSQIKEISDTKLIPCIPGSSGCAQVSTDRQAALEYPPLAKEEIAQVWLADFTSTTNPPAAFFTKDTLDVYWGDPATSTDKAALELSIIYYDGTSYKIQKKFFDQIVRTPANNFDTSANCSGTFQFTKKYQCKISLTGLPSGLMLLRIRLLYNSTSQPFAVQAPACSGVGCYLPSQARMLTSTGISGQTQRKVQVFQISKIVPPYFDFALFSTGDIKK